MGGNAETRKITEEIVEILQKKTLKFDNDDIVEIVVAIATAAVGLRHNRNER